MRHDPLHVRRHARSVVLCIFRCTTVVSYQTAARLLAGLEVALAAALREAGRGKCLKCGRVSAREDGPRKRHGSWCHCGYCGGILSPLPAREGEG